MRFQSCDLGSIPAILDFIYLFLLIVFLTT
jgi:hypothetical protein